MTQVGRLESLAGLEHACDDAAAVAASRLRELAAIEPDVKPFGVARAVVSDDESALAAGVFEHAPEEDLRSPRQILSQEQLLEHVWDEMADPMTNVVRVTVSNLRKKLGEPSPISTIPGRGYRLDD